MNIQSLLRRALLLALFPCLAWAAAGQSRELPEPSVRVNHQDGLLVLDISYQVPVSPREAWAVLTDFEHMAEFIPNLDSSKVLQRTGKLVEVEQKGSASIGLLPIHYESRRQVEFIPYQTIRSQTLSGNGRLESTMLLTPAGSGTLLTYHATAVPDLPVPVSLVSAYFNDMLEMQFKAMGQEMLRRAQAGNKGADEEPPPILQLPVQQAAGQPPLQPAANLASSQVSTQNKLAPKKYRAQTKKRPG